MGMHAHGLTPVAWLLSRYKNTNVLLLLKINFQGAERDAHVVPRPQKLTLGDLASGRAFDNGCACLDSLRGAVSCLRGGSGAIPPTCICAAI